MAYCDDDVMTCSERISCRARDTQHSMRSILRLMAGALRAQGLLQTSGTPFSYVSLAVAGSPRDQLSVALLTLTVLAGTRTLAAGAPSSSPVKVLYTYRWPASSQGLFPCDALPVLVVCLDTHQVGALHRYRAYQLCPWRCGGELAVKVCQSSLETLPWQGRRARRQYWAAGAAAVDRRTPECGGRRSGPSDSQQNCGTASQTSAGRAPPYY